MKPFGWEIVKQISYAGDLINNVNFSSALQEGYKEGWLEGQRLQGEDFVVDTFDMYDENKCLAYIPTYDKDAEPGFEEESQAYRLGYSLAINDCARLHKLGASITRKFSNNV